MQGEGADRHDSPIGTGHMDLRTIIDTTKGTTEWYIVEQDNPEDPLADAQISLKRHAIPGRLATIQARTYRAEYPPRDTFGTANHILLESHSDLRNPPKFEMLRPDICRGV